MTLTDLQKQTLIDQLVAENDRRAFLESLNALTVRKQDGSVDYDKTNAALEVARKQPVAVAEAQVDG